MMNTQELKSNAGIVQLPGECLASGQVMRLGSAGGEVTIVSGRVWLTSAGDLGDHVLEAGESFRVTARGPTLVEAWDPVASARIDWRPRTALERVSDGLAVLGGRCWDFVSPASRLGIGTAAALVGILAAAMLFGPVSQARVRALVKPSASSASLLHNAAGVAVGATDMRGTLADGRDTRDRPSRPAQEAGRRAPGAA